MHQLHCYKVSYSICCICYSQLHTYIIANCTQPVYNYIYVHLLLQATVYECEPSSTTTLNNFYVPKSKKYQ